VVAPEVAGTTPALVDKMLAREPAERTDDLREVTEAATEPMSPGRQT
jgi:hypothetical protein